jgi:predicted amidohydrolase YtcJ
LNTEKPHSETIYINGPLVSAPKHLEYADAFSVTDGKFDKIGQTSELRLLAKSNTIIVDLLGKSVIPGLTDSHFHQIYFGLADSWIDLTNIKKIENVVQILVANINRSQSGNWIYARGLDQSIFNDYGQNNIVERLKVISKNHPLILSRSDGHGCIVNSEALKKVGIIRTTENPLGGIIEKDQGGDPTGRLFESALYGPWNLMMQDLSSEQFQQAIIKSSESLIQEGVTSSHAILLENINMEIMELRKLDRLNTLPVRVYGIISEEFIDEVDPALLNQNWKSLKIGGAKLFSDGTLRERTASLTKPYKDSPHIFGNTSLDSNNLNTKLLRIKSKGLQPVIHAIGDNAIEQVLSGLDQIFTKEELIRYRPRIEHASVLSPNLIKRINNLGITLSLQKRSIKLEQQRLGNDRLRWTNPWSYLIDQNVKVIVGSDSPFMQSRPGPIQAITESIYQGIDPEVVIDRLSMESAIASFSEKTNGSIEKHKNADFTVLSDDPKTMPKDTLGDLRPIMTVVGGIIKWESSN